jgi:hypothetical protein
MLIVAEDHAAATMTLQQNLCLQVSQIVAVHSILTTANALTIYCECPHTTKRLKIQVILRRHPIPGAVIGVVFLSTCLCVSAVTVMSFCMS